MFLPASAYVILLLRGNLGVARRDTIPEFGRCRSFGRCRTTENVLERSWAHATIMTVKQWPGRALFEMSNYGNIELSKVTKYWNVEFCKAPNYTYIDRWHLLLFFRRNMYSFTLSSKRVRAWKRYIHLPLFKKRIQYWYSRPWQWHLTMDITRRNQRCLH